MYTHTVIGIAIKHHKSILEKFHIYINIITNEEQSHKNINLNHTAYTHIGQAYQSYNTKQSHFKSYSVHSYSNRHSNHTSQNNLRTILYTHQHYMSINQNIVKYTQLGIVMFIKLFYLYQHDFNQ